MATWAKKIIAHGEKQKAATKPRKARPPLQETWAQVRPSNGSDPGEVIPCFFTVNEGVLTVTDEKGAPIEEITAYTLLPSDNPASLACSFAMQQKRSGDPTGFN